MEKGGICWALEVSMSPVLPPRRCRVWVPGAGEHFHPSSPVRMSTSCSARSPAQTSKLQLRVGGDTPECRSIPRELPSPHIALPHHLHPPPLPIPMELG